MLKVGVTWRNCSHKHWKISASQRSVRKGVNHKDLGNAFNKKPDSCNPLLMTFKYSLWQNCIRAWERFTIAQSIYCCTNNSQVIEEFKKALVILKMTYGEDNPTLL